MQYISVVEMPKGTDRRIHMSYDKTGFVDLGPIKDHIPVNEGVMPVHYGFIEETLNKDDGDEVDVLIFSNSEIKTGDKVNVQILGMLKREDGDNKVIARDETVDDLVFENLNVDERKTILDYMGYKSPIISIETKDKAIEYINSCLK
jgi:inorganic pyrophosphatase